MHQWCLAGISYPALSATHESIPLGIGFMLEAYDDSRSKPLAVPSFAKSGFLFRRLSIKR